MRILVSHFRQLGDICLGSIVAELFKKRHPNFHLKYIVGNNTAKELLQFNPFIDELDVIEYESMEYYNFETTKHLYDHAVRLLFWSKNGLDSWESCISRSFALQAGFTLNEISSVYPKIYWLNEDLERSRRIVEKLGLKFENLVVGALDGDLVKYREIVETWSIRKGLRYLNANEGFAKRFGLNFREIGCLAASSLFAVAQEGGWLHVAACSGAKTVGIPRRINPLVSMPGYYMNKFLDTKKRHLYVNPPDNMICKLYSDKQFQRPCNYINNTSADIVHKGIESCPPKTYPCELHIQKEDLEFVLNTALSELN